MYVCIYTYIHTYIYYVCLEGSDHECSWILSLRCLGDIERQNQTKSKKLMWTGRKIGKLLGMLVIITEETQI